MKLWKKLALMTITVLFTVTGASGAVLIAHTAQYNEEKTLENYEQQLCSTAQSVGKELDLDVLETYSSTTRRSYFNYLMKKYGAEQYILLYRNQVICNLTPFDLAKQEKARWSGRTAESVIQKTGEQYVLITGKAVSAIHGGDFRLVLVRDISEVYEDIREQAVLFAAVYLAGTGLAVVLVFFLTKRILASLKELQKAAEAISAGKLAQRAGVRTRDEVGMVAEAFNRMAEQIEQQMAELSAVSEQRRQMMGSLAHELKTPMTSIIGYAQTLLHVKVKKEQQERALNHIYEESLRLERLGSKLMSLIGLYDNDSICIKDTDMKELLKRVAELENYHLAEKQVHLEVSCAMKEKKLDQDLFESLLVNLIDNAVKASQPGDTVFVTAEKDSLTIRDQGCGIPKEEVLKVKEAFYMVDKARSRRAGGSGLGLALCERIAKLHGAVLLIESEAGRGTAVTVQFEQGEDRAQRCL